ncbi:MAG: methyltransferase [Thermoplasmataceae archaeon]
MSIIEFDGISIHSCEGVYQPSDDTFLLMKNADPGHTIIEIGCGTGIVSLYFSKLGHDVVAVDISERAVECTLKNARANGIKLKAFRSDLFSNVSGTFDSVLFNAPYLPSEDNVPEATQWNGGAGGIEVASRFLSEAANHLNRGGTIFLVLSSLSDVSKLKSMHRNYAFENIAKASFFYEEILLFRLALAR